ncbi:MAG: pyruvate, phosphate dikinase [Dehalococcoidia bacterium]|nr:pyruvate, phosphate dikinase [Dehalococcoidia bacterium]
MLPELHPGNHELQKDAVPLKEPKEGNLSYIYSFTDGCSDSDLLGNKGANLVTMTRLGLPVPPGFVVSIDAYRQYRNTGVVPEMDIEAAVSAIENQAGQKLGQGLQVSVRSSAPVSMPGMMDTLLNLKDIQEVRKAVKQVFDSWDSPRAIEYRRMNRIPADLGTAAIVQAMVFGDKDSSSGTGVIFTRDPSTGEKGILGEYLHQAQGEELVSGSETPQPVSALASRMPEVYQELERIGDALELHFRDMQDIEFTVESGKLYILQTRSGKRGGYAAVKIAIDLVDENVITPQEALLMVRPEDLQALLHRQIKSPERYKPLTKGLNAAPGATTGIVVFDVTEAVSLAQKTVPVILVRPETSPDDILGIVASHGVLTQKGGLTSHAAIVTRAMGKPCVCGASDILINLAEQRFEVGGRRIKKGDQITIDGTTGNVYDGALELGEVDLPPGLKRLTDWADGFKHLGVMANADTPDMISRAVQFGAEGIGLCRTERMFNEPKSLSMIRDFLLADSPDAKARAIESLEGLQRQDFVALFRELQGLPIIVRLLDLPLHEFLPPEHEIQDASLRQRVADLKEVNPMMGHRGVRLAATHPEIYKMQIRAIEAALDEVPADVSIMIPQVVSAQEVLLVQNLLGNRRIRLGIMMETVRACMRAGKLAHEVDFLSFGTNDLTQAVYSFSREDAEKKFLTTYLQAQLLQDNPFEVIDAKGVGRLMETAIFWARRAKRHIKISVCGEQAGEPRSIRFFHGIGVDNVSCSPFRIQAAKLVAAQAAIKTKTDAQEEYTMT